MPLTLPDRLPAISLLEKENIFVMGTTRAATQDIRPLRIVVLNLMPIKITTETDLVRVLSNTPLQLDLTFMKIKSHTSKNTPIEHMRAFYKDFEVLRSQKFDGMIITGAPVEHLDYTDVTYWDEMTDIFSWARTHVTSTLYICWAAQAGLYYHYGVPKHPLPSKMFGIFPQTPLLPSLPIFRGFDDVFQMPHSRHTEIRREEGFLQDRRPPYRSRGPLQDRRPLYRSRGFSRGFHPPPHHHCRERGVGRQHRHGTRRARVLHHRSR